MEIERGVRTAFTLDPDVDATGIDVSAENGVVTLSGRVRSDDERGRVLRGAEMVHGVRRVVDELGS